MTLHRVAAPLREQVLELLRNDIVEQRLRPGHRLIERELIEQIGVSRTTIREVLRQLGAEGLVTTIPQKGAIVAALTPEEAQDLYEVRAALEALAARRFAQRATPAQVTALRRAFTAFERQTNDGAAIRNCSAPRMRFTTCCSRDRETPRSTRSSAACARVSRCCAPRRCRRPGGRRAPSPRSARSSRRSRPAIPSARPLPQRTMWSRQRRQLSERSREHPARRAQAALRRGVWPLGRVARCLLELDPDFFEAYVGFSAVPWRDGAPRAEGEGARLYRGRRGGDAPVRAGYPPAYRRALELGATEAELLEVLELTSTLGHPLRHHRRAGTPRGAGGAAAIRPR